MKSVHRRLQILGKDGGQFDRHCPSRHTFASTQHAIPHEYVPARHIVVASVASASASGLNYVVNIERKIADWAKAGIIDAVTAERIGAFWRLRTGEGWLFEIRGYDPRDLLHGRYLNFNVEVQADDGRCPDAGACCYCLTSTGLRQPPEALYDLSRFYVAEQHATRAESLLQASARLNQARIEVAVDANGRPHIKDLWLGDKRLSDSLVQ